MKKKSRYLKMEESRNRRLWLTTVFIPIATAATTLYAGVPKFREFVDNGILNIHEVYNLKKTELKHKMGGS